MSTEKSRGPPIVVAINMSRLQPEVLIHVHKKMLACRHLPKPHVLDLLNQELLLVRVPKSKETFKFLLKGFLIWRIEKLVANVV